jgi:hypothetical protein
MTEDGDGDETTGAATGGLEDWLEERPQQGWHPEVVQKWGRGVEERTYVKEWLKSNW